MGPERIGDNTIAGRWHLAGTVGPLNTAEVDMTKVKAVRYRIHRDSNKTKQDESFQLNTSGSLTMFPAAAK